MYKILYLLYLYYIPFFTNINIYTFFTKQITIQIEAELDDDNINASLDTNILLNSSSKHCNSLSGHNNKASFVTSL